MIKEVEMRREFYKQCSRLVLQRSPVVPVPRCSSCGFLQLQSRRWEERKLVRHIWPAARPSTLGRGTCSRGPLLQDGFSTSEWVEGASGSWSVNTAQGLTSGYILGYFISNVRSLGTLCFAVLTSKP